MSESNFRRELLEQARALVFNTGADAAALAFRGKGADETEAPRDLDLTALASIHRAANGAVDLKFIDRIKLIELLLDAGREKRAEPADGFIQALDRAARRLGAEDAAGEAGGYRSERARSRAAEGCTGGCGDGADGYGAGGYGAGGCTGRGVGLAAEDGADESGADGYGTDEGEYGSDGDDASGAGGCGDGAEEDGDGGMERG